VPRVLGVGHQVLDVDDGPRQDRAPGHQTAVRSHRERSLKRLERFRGAVVMGGEMNQLPIEAVRGAVQSIAQAHGASHDRIEDRLDVGGRLADHSQNLARRRLLVECLLEVAVGNAVTLMELKDPPYPRRQALLPVVRYAVERRMATGKLDYWDHATLLELAVLGKEEAAATAALGGALAAVREPWEPVTTARNLRLIREALASRSQASA
jgi:hypothetical protein